METAIQKILVILIHKHKFSFTEPVQLVFIQGWTWLTEPGAPASSQPLVLSILQSPLWLPSENCFDPAVQASGGNQTDFGLTWSAGAGSGGTRCVCHTVCCSPDWIRVHTKRSTGGYFSWYSPLQPGSVGKSAAQQHPAEDYSITAATLFHIGFKSSKQQRASTCCLLSQRADDDFSTSPCRRDSQAAGLLGLWPELWHVSGPPQLWGLLMFWQFS